MLTEAYRIQLPSSSTLEFKSGSENLLNFRKNLPSEAMQTGPEQLHPGSFQQKRT